jgi:integrase
VSRGTIIRRGNGYSVVLDLGRGPDGKRIRRWHSGFRTKRDAERARVELLARVDSGAYVEPSRLTLGTFLVEQWLRGLAGQVRQTTLHSYSTNLERYVVPRIGATLLQRLTPARLNGLYAELLAAGGRDSRPLSARTVQAVHMTVRKAIGDAARWGMRRGELLGLRWVDVDLDLARVAIRQTLVLAGRQVVTSEPKTSRGRRSIALDPRTVAALRAWRAAQAAERLQWGSAWTDSGMVFTREDGTPIHPETFSDQFAWRVKVAGLRPIRLHDLRHTHASLGLAAGVPIKVMSERLGHTSSSFTADAYQHVTPALEEQAAATVARLVFGPSLRSS